MEPALAIGGIDPLIGREGMLAEVALAVARNRLVTLTGLGGAGKTRLARALVDTQRNDREAFFFDLSQLTDGADLAATVAAQLQLGGEGDPDRVVAAWAGSGPRLLALDNLEQASGIVEPILELLRHAEDLRVVATSRSPLGAAGEYEVRIPGLALPTGDSAAEVEHSPAGALFLGRARAVGGLRGALDPATAADVAELCRMLDGLPLAIELAAARARILSPAAIRRRLEAHDTAALKRATGDVRHRSLEAVLDWSLAQLSDRDLATLEACAACSGTFGLPLVERMVGADVLLSVETLVRHGLVAVDDEVAGVPRFRLLESVRLTIRARSGERLEEFSKRHASAVAAMAEELGPELDGDRPRSALAQLDADLANVLAAVAWASGEAPELASRLLWATSGYFTVRGATAEAAAAARSLISAEALDERHHVLALGALIRMAGQFEPDDASRNVALEAASRARAAGAGSVELEALMLLAYLSEEPGLRTERGEILDRIFAIAPQTARDRVLIARAHYVAALDAGGVVGGRDYLQMTLPDICASGSVAQLSFWLANLAYMHQRLEQSAAAIEIGKESVALARSLGQPDLEAYALGVVAAAEAQLGHLDDASSTYGWSLRLAVALGAQRPVAQALYDRGTIAAVLGAPRDAAWFLGAAEAAYAPTPVSAFDDLAGAVHVWKAARRSAGPTAWELARREGRAASREEAVQRAVAPLATPGPGKAMPILRHGLLTKREVEILTLLAEGASDGEIAERLFISAKTASVHVANAKAKLGSSSRLDLALRAREVLGIPDTMR